MEFARDPLAFRHPLFVPALDGGRDLPHPQRIDQPQRQRREDRAQEHEPAALNEGGRNLERERGAGRVPDAVIVRRDHMEAVMAGAQAHVERLSSIAGVDPGPVDAFEPVAELHPVGVLQAERGIVDLQVGNPRGELAHLRGVQGVAFDRERSDADRRRNRVPVETVRIDPGDVVRVEEPEAPVRAAHRGASKLRDRPCGLKAVTGVEQLVGEARRRIAERLFQLARRNAIDPGGRVEPGSAEIVRDDPQHHAKKGRLSPREGVELASVEPCDALVASQQNAPRISDKGVGSADVRPVGRGIDLEPIPGEASDLFLVEQPDGVLAVDPQARRRDRREPWGGDLGPDVRSSSEQASLADDRPKVIPVQPRGDQARAVRPFGQWDRRGDAVAKADQRLAAPDQDVVPTHRIQHRHIADWDDELSGGAVGDGIDPLCAVAGRRGGRRPPIGDIDGVFRGGDFRAHGPDRDRRFGDDVRRREAVQTRRRADPDVALAILEDPSWNPGCQALSRRKGFQFGSARCDRAYAIEPAGHCVRAPERSVAIERHAAEHPLGHSRANLRRRCRRAGRAEVGKRIEAPGRHVGGPQSAVGGPGEVDDAARVALGLHEAGRAGPQEVEAKQVFRPHHAVTPDRQAPDAAGFPVKLGRAPVAVHRLPAPSVEVGDLVWRGDPDLAVAAQRDVLNPGRPIKAGHGEGGEPAVAQPGDSGGRADPEIACRGRRERDDRTAGELLFERLDVNAVEPVETGCGAEPEVAVRRLGERAHIGRHAVAERPGGVVELGQAAGQVQRTRLGAREAGADQHDESQSQSDQASPHERYANPLPANPHTPNGRCDPNPG